MVMEQKPGVPVTKTAREWEFLTKFHGKFNLTKASYTVLNEGGNNIQLSAGKVYKTEDIDEAALLYQKKAVCVLTKGDEPALKERLKELSELSKAKRMSAEKLANIAEVLKALTA